MKIEMNPARKAAEEHLRNLVNIKARLLMAQDCAEVEMERVRGQYADRLTALQNEFKVREKQLITLMKEQTGDIFDGRDRVDLAHGSLLYSIERRVKRARGVLENLKKLKIMDAIKVTEKVNWDKLEKWPVEKLVLVGTKRTRKEQYSYELANAAAHSSQRNYGDRTEKAEGQDPLD